jgi:hypothetical protein
MDTSCALLPPDDHNRLPLPLPQPPMSTIINCLSSR